MNKPYGGTIFLDEIGEMELSLQAKLLRVLEEATFRRVGGLKDIKLDARIIAASNRNLKQESENGNFRLDLYFRLSVIQVDIPPLRDRGNDVILLANHYIEKANLKRRGLHSKGCHLRSSGFQALSLDRQCAGIEKCDRTGLDPRGRRYGNGDSYAGRYARCSRG